eukprot:Sspe_Gene.114573::Locus_100393_Transcript_1_1_Confidence_1.000_Length_372::g.114573::m.114573
MDALSRFVNMEGRQKHDCILYRRLALLNLPDTSDDLLPQGDVLRGPPDGTIAKHDLPTPAALHTDESAAQGRRPRLPPRRPLSARPVSAKTHLSRCYPVEAMCPPGTK